METRNENATNDLKNMQDLMNSNERRMINMYDDNGRLVQQIEYKLGVPDGKGFTYNPDTGNKIQEMNFINGKLHGEMIIFDQLGDIAAKLTYVDGILYGPCEFYVDGKMVLSGQYKDGKYDGVLTYYDTFLNIVKEETYVNGLKEGKVITYSPNKKILKSENYKKGDMVVGLSSQRPYEQGKAVAIATARALLEKHSTNNCIGVAPYTVRASNLEKAWKDILHVEWPND